MASGLKTSAISLATRVANVTRPEQELAIQVGERCQLGEMATLFQAQTCVIFESLLHLGRTPLQHNERTCQTTPSDRGKNLCVRQLASSDMFFRYVEEVSDLSAARIRRCHKFELETSSPSPLIGTISTSKKSPPFQISSGS